MNILVILPWLPYPANFSGGHQAIYNGLEALSRISDVSVVYYERSKHTGISLIQDFEQSFPRKNVHVYPFSPTVNQYTMYEKLSRAVSKLCSVVLGRYKEEKTKRLLISITYPRSYLDYIVQLIKFCKIDVVQMEFLANLPLVTALPAHIKKIFVHHEIGFVVHERQIDLRESDIWTKAVFEMSKAQEVALLNLFNQVITLSPVDKDKLVSAGVSSEKIEVSYAIVKQPSVVDEGRHVRKVLSAIGPEGNYPGLKWFLDYCWQSLLQRDAEFTLQIIGRWSDEMKNSILSSYVNIKFLGFVDDLTQAIEGTTVIVPLKIGSGIRMKILDAVSRKVPFVATTVGAEGLPFADGEDAYITDAPERFVEAIFKLQQPNIRKAMVEVAYNKYKADFTMSSLVDKRKAILEKL